MSSRAESGSGGFDPQQLLERLNREFPQPQHYWVAFSGGLDSSVLLHALAGVGPHLRAPLAAIHVDHSLQAGSADWAEHCARQCERLKIPLTTLSVDARPRPGQSPEAAARAVRYAAIAAVVGPRAMLLTAHQRDDQAETLLLQLLRGAGVAGLAAMPAIRAWQDGWQARPLLGWRRAELETWARARQLHWIDDPSNADTAADRNYLRHRLLPLLTARWPGAVEGIARSAGLCAEAAESIRWQAAQDLQAAVSQDGRRLQLAPLCALPPVRARNALRHWLHGQGAGILSQRRLEDALGQLCAARADAAVRIAWGGCELRRFAGQAWLLSGQPARPPAQRFAWSGEEMCPGPGLGRLRRRLCPGGIDRDYWQAGRVQIGYREAGLRCTPVGRAGARTFKKIAQDQRIPPWLRDLTPVVYIDGRVAAIANACVCEPFAARAGESGWVVDWLPD